MHNKLLQIIEKKKKDLIQQMEKVPLKKLKEKIIISQQENLFLKNLLNTNGVGLIAEIKFASPTNPSLGSKEELLQRAKVYEQAGANAISLITEKHFFKGELSFIKKIKEVINLPILQKDFVIDVYQIYEAKSIGSDALLLIARLVNTETLQSYVVTCQELGIEPVVEVNNEEDLEKAAETDTKIIAVNARDLETFHVDISTACRLMKKIPDNFIKLGFSGINSATEVEQYKKARARGVLVGTSLMNTKNIGNFISSLRANEESAAISNKIASSQASRNDRHVLVKICGVRTLEGANVAIKEGADFLGFNFVPTSKRFIDLKNAQEIIKHVRGKVNVVGVFQNAPVDEVNRIAEMLDLDYVQLHGEEDEDYMKKIKKRIIKKYNVHSFTDLNESVAYVLLDREVQGKGKMVDLEKAAKINAIFPLFFSGGLTPENVSEVIQEVKPFAVDVAGGIETNGKEDLEKIKTFITNAKEVVV